MKAEPVQIYWHELKAILSVDLHPLITGLLVTASADSTIRMWTVDMDFRVEYKYTLKRQHVKGVNIVRFSPPMEQVEGESPKVLLASAGDDCNICIWEFRDCEVMEVGDDRDRKESSDGCLEEAQPDDEERVEWVVDKSLRGHHADVYDLCWSSNGDYIVSGSIDNAVIVWDVAKGKAVQEFRNHDKFVRGVSWDPLGEFITSIGCDRTLNIHPVTVKEKRLRRNKTKKIVQKSTVIKKLQVQDNGVSTFSFHDDNVAIYFSRHRFSPDGAFLFVPSVEVCCESTKSTSSSPAPAAAVFLRNKWHKPWRILAGFDSPTTSIAVNPKSFSLRCGQKISGLDINHRWVYAVTSLSAVVIYDTEQRRPLSVITNLHLAQITDCNWSSDGRMLAICSTDGYCSFVIFNEGELGSFESFSIVPSTSNFTFAATTAVPSPQGVSDDQPEIEDKFEEINIIQPRKKKKLVQPTLFEATAGILKNQNTVTVVSNSSDLQDPAQQSETSTEKNDVEPVTTVVEVILSPSDKEEDSKMEIDDPEGSSSILNQDSEMEVDITADANQNAQEFITTTVQVINT
eukprot:TRINITY_DN6930_c0_g1_i2.p1 TRINITY_DN6930_c0_g1~~TRINITY_DN6930_c0_g1_i2.p1  ORF type:complete len:597 (-),score=150.41 TRINITY_DN6930_c0_g1_i2:25-1737(-)